MASMNLNEKDSVRPIPIENLLELVDLDNSCESDACDDRILPSIGDEFQVKIPSMIERSNYLSYLLDPADSKDEPHFSGLDMDITWIDLNHPIPSKNPIKKETCSSGNDNLREEDKCLVPMPSSGVKWTEDEKASFILGLYIFRKNFVMITRFVESKEMGAILLFYHGEFYGSDEYNRWSEWRKETKNSKKYLSGQRIFSGWRHQVLMSRLLPTLSEDHRNALSEVSKKFSEKKISLVDYVSSLKSIVGITALVEAIGIGKGKLDLTGLAMEIPTGKACSYLTFSEIIRFLSGDYRLSKARSDDLFWEAVWPRLLARGWHSEQPGDHSYISGVNICLVFLVPGVEKFSRRKLVKGEHYYDSFSDILSKVAKEPEIIQLDTDIEINGKNEEDDDDDLTLTKRQRYLQPRKTNRIAGVKVVTVVDTSLPGGNIRALRSLRTENSIPLTCKDLKLSHEDTDESETTTKKSKKVTEEIEKEHLAPVRKRCKKDTGMNMMNKSGLGLRLENGISSCTREFDMNVPYTISPKGSPDESFNCDTSGTKRRILIDLNVPQVSPEFENEFFVTGQENQRSEPEIVNPRRQGTRKRPPTARSLEAVADGFLTVTPKRRTKKSSSSNVELAQVLPEANEKPVSG